MKHGHDWASSSYFSLFIFFTSHVPELKAFQLEFWPSPHLFTPVKPCSDYIVSFTGHTSDALLHWTWQSTFSALHSLVCNRLASGSQLISLWKINRSNGSVINL